MSIQSEVTRLQNAKTELKTAIQNKGVTVPGGTTLDGYAALVQQIETGDMKQSVYDPQGKAQDIFAYGFHLYKAVFLLDGWTGSGPYTQTVQALAVTGGPAVTARSRLVGGCLMEDSLAGQAEVQTAAALVDAGTKTLGSGTISCEVFSKPTADTEVYFYVMKGDA